MLLLYSEKLSARIRYIADIYFKDLLQISYKITDDLDAYNATNRIRINYGHKRIADDEIFIQADDILFESTITKQSPQVITYENIKVLYPKKDGDLPYDPLAAGFFLISRYEEYLPFKSDHHGRFPAESSIAYKNNFLQKPVLHYYATHLKDLIQNKKPRLTFPEIEYKFLLTYDIDMAWSYLEKGWVRNFKGLLNDFLFMQWNDLLKRIKVLSNKREDPFDTFSYQISLNEKHDLHPLYFFLLADHGKYDKNIPAGNKRLEALIASIAEKYETGIHPGYRSNDDINILKNEIERLAKITWRKTTKSRQHYLKIIFPETYEKLIACGIEEDYTMGYSSQIGFRAGISIPFYFFNLKTNEPTTLRIFPFAVMDATLRYHLKLSADEALQKINALTEEVKKVKGLFIFLAHNDMLSTENKWKGWKNNFEKMIANAKS